MSAAKRQRTDNTANQAYNDNVRKAIENIYTMEPAKLAASRGSATGIQEPFHAAKCAALCHIVYPDKNVPRAWKRAQTRKEHDKYWPNLKQKGKKRDC